MSGLQKLDPDQPNVALLADDLLSEKLAVYTHPGEVLDDQTLTLADKRSLLASWASDALAVEDAPSLRQLPSGAVVRVDDIIGALKTLDLRENRHEASLTFSQSFARSGRMFRRLAAGLLRRRSTAGSRSPCAVRVPRP
jgi:hypothetical protein